MAGFLFRLEIADGVPAEPSTLLPNTQKTRMSNWDGPL